MIVNIDEVKEHLKIDDSEEDIYLEMLIKASEEFLFNATGKKFDSSNNLAKVSILFLIGDMYENRMATTDKVSSKIREIVAMLITQLAY